MTYRSKILAGVLGAAISLSIAAQGQMVAPPGDPRLQVVAYLPDQVTVVQAAPGYQVTIELAPDEEIQSVAVGDSGAWQATASRSGNYLFVKPLTNGVSTNMTVVTSARRYAFDLRPAMNGIAGAAYVMQFRYPPQSVNPAVSDNAPMIGRYKMNGAKALRPIRISDDGVHTYVEWAPDVPLPAVYARDAAGRESLVNGIMRDDVFVIDSIVASLVFRIDDQTAVATRARPRRGR